MYTHSDIQKVLRIISQSWIASEPALTELDGHLGDGDLGQSLLKGGEALNEVLDHAGGQSISECLTLCAQAFNRAAPSTMGTLLSFSMMDLANAFKGMDALSDQDVIGIPRRLAQSIERLGKAHPGDKTILDALYPCADAMEASFAAEPSLRKALVCGAKAAREGTEKTKGIEARMGRARWMGSRNAEYPDPGCVMLAEVLAALEKAAAPGHIDSLDIMQITILVPDIEAAVRNVSELFGIEAPNIRYHSGPDKCAFYFRGERCEVGAARLCTFTFGPVGFEFVEVCDSQNNSWKDYLDKYGYGVHNIGFYVNDLSGALGALEAKGVFPIHEAYFPNESYRVVDSEKLIGTRLNIKHRGEENTRMIHP